MYTGNTYVTLQYNYNTIIVQHAYIKYFTPKIRVCGGGRTAPEGLPDHQVRAARDAYPEPLLREVTLRCVDMVEGIHVATVDQHITVSRTKDKRQSNPL